MEKMETITMIAWRKSAIGIRVPMRNGLTMKKQSWIGYSPLIPTLNVSPNGYNANHLRYEVD